MIFFNGINPRTGGYLVPPVEESELLELLSESATGLPGKVKSTEESALRDHLHRKLPNAGLPVAVNENDPAAAGWGIVFHENEQPELIKSAEELIKHRKTMVPDHHLKILTYRSGQTVNKWLAEHGVGSGHVDPAKVPYYLLLVGEPEKIPFSFSQRLGLEYRVGRLPFDEPWQLANYTRSLIRHERHEGGSRSTDVLVFAPEHDAATELSARYLADPLAQQFANRMSLQSLRREEATKYHLLELLRAGAARCLFSASHGLGLDAGDERQTAEQGAIVCPRDTSVAKPLTTDDYFSAKDLSPEIDLTGTMLFCFACFSAATPSVDRFFRRKGQALPLAPKSFFSALPIQMLVNPGGAALAVAGHIDRAWGCSILNEKSDPLLLPFDNALSRALKGIPCGQMLKDFYDRYASYSIELTDLLETRDLGGNVPDRELFFAWTRRNDAGGYILLGDPAARLL
jgi:hypothetical protein